MVVYDATNNQFHIEHYTEGEIAHYLKLCGVNTRTTKEEKLKFARAKVEPLIAALWRRVNELERYHYRAPVEAKRASSLAMKLDSLEGLTSIVRLAGVIQ
jgi:hypothetical protein